MAAAATLGAEPMHNLQGPECSVVLHPAAGAPGPPTATPASSYQPRQLAPTGPEEEGPEGVAREEGCSEVPCAHDDAAAASPPPAKSTIPSHSHSPSSTAHSSHQEEGPVQHNQETVSSQQVEEDEDIAAWRKQGYFMPAEHGDEATAGAAVAHKYRPPRSDVGGVCVALAVISVWAALFYHAMFQVKLPWDLGGALRPGPMSHWLDILGTFFALEFMYTGLFITTHDSMHGAIAMRHRKLNDALGTLAISLYAWFDFSMLHEHHWEHHNHTGVVGKDPDFHRGNPNVLVWFVRFMLEYMSAWQFAKIAMWAALMQLLGVPMANIYVYMTAAPVLSAVRLFYYGTYVPHHPEPGPKADSQEMPWPTSRSSSVPTLLSFLTCYHFDLHWEHHRWPYAPWWELPKCRELAREARAGLASKKAL